MQLGLFFGESEGIEDSRDRLGIFFQIIFGAQNGHRNHLSLT
jgi:hypothetical protein